MPKGSCTCAAAARTFVTSFGRNVAPEWVETELQSQSAVAHAVVFGNDAPVLSAVLWPAHADCADRALERAVHAANAALPDYARMRTGCAPRCPSTRAHGMATANGRPCRTAIAAAHAASLQVFRDGSLHDDADFHERLLAETASSAPRCRPFRSCRARCAAQFRCQLRRLPTQAFHHVRHTVPLLAACRAALPPRLAWMAPALDDYIVEEAGHDPGSSTISSRAG